MYLSELNWSQFSIQQFCGGMAAFYKITSRDYEGLQVILMSELFTIGNTDYKIRQIKLTQMICTHTHTHTHTHNFPLEILIWVPETLNIFEHISFIARIFSVFSTRDSEALWRTAAGTVGTAVLIPNNHDSNTNQQHHRLFQPVRPN